MNKTELKTKIGSVLVENNEGLITAADVSGLLTDVLDCTEIGGSQTMIIGSSLWAGSLQIYNGSIQHQNNLDIIVGAGTVMKINSSGVTISKDLTVNSNNVNFESLSGSVTCRNLNVKNNIKATGSITAREVYLNGTGSDGGVLSCKKIDLYVENAGFPIPIKSIYTNNVPNGIRINDGSIVYGSTGIQNLSKSNYIDFASGSIKLSTGKFDILYITRDLADYGIFINNGEIYNDNHSKVISMGYKSGSINGFDSIELGTDSTTMTLNKNGIISGATGKYIDLYNGSIAGITVSGTVPSNLTPSNIYMSGSRATIYNCNKLDMNPSVSNGTAGTITGVSSIYFADGTGVISGTIGSMTINGIDLNYKKIDNCSGIYFAGPTCEISGVNTISIGYGTIIGLSNLNMISGTITGVNRIITNHIKGSVKGNFNTTGIIVENDLHFGDEQTSHIVINDSSIKVWDTSIRQSNNVINIDEQGNTTFANSIKIGSTTLDENTLIALKKLLTQ